MADYISDTQSRTSHSDMNVLLSAYTHMSIPMLPKDEMASRISELKEWVARASSSMHNSVETEIVVRDGSIITEIIVSGHLFEILNIDNLKVMGLVIKGDDIVAGHLGYFALRAIIRALIKDIKGSTLALSRMTRWVFNLKIGDFKYSESRTGVFGELSRFLNSIDSAISKTVLIKKRKEFIGRAYKTMKKIEQISTNVGDRKMLCFYIGREIKDMQEIPILKSMDDKEIGYANEFNFDLKSIRGLCEILCNS